MRCEDMRRNRGMGIVIMQQSMEEGGMAAEMERGCAN